MRLSFPILFAFVLCILSFVFLFGRDNASAPLVVMRDVSSVTAKTPTVEQKVADVQLPPTVTADSDYHAVVRVIDGDTIVVDMNGVDETIRLIGIDTPETVDPRKLVGCFGKEASDKAKELLTGARVRVVIDPTQDTRDKYGRLLAYIFRDEGLFINKYMVEQGYAYEYAHIVPHKYQTEFKTAQKEAKATQRGLWAQGTCDAKPTAL